MEILLRCGGVALLLGVAATREAQAQEDVNHPEVHGFVSQGFLYTTANDYLADSSRGSFEFTEAGINFTVEPTDQLRVGLQLFARDLGPVGDYAAKVDWLYVDYRWKDWLGVRAGRVKLPFGLYNELTDVDAARVPVLLPQSIYPSANRDFLLAQTGVEAYGRVDLCAAGLLDYRLYYGTIFVDAENDPTAPILIAEVRVPYIAGGRLLWEAPVDGLELALSGQALELEADILSQGMPFTIDVPALLSVASVEYWRDELTLSAEYSRWWVEVESSQPMLFPSDDTTSERGYVMATYRLSSLVQLGGYYSLLFPDVAMRQGAANRQHDVAATVRLDLNPWWLLKLEAHYMNGTADLDVALNDGTPRDMLEEQWGLFLVKTTAVF